MAQFRKRTGAHESLEGAIARGNTEAIRAHGEALGMGTKEITRLQKKSVKLQRRYGTFGSRVATAARRGVATGLLIGAVATVGHMQAPALMTHFAMDRELFATHAHERMVSETQGALNFAKEQKIGREHIRGLQTKLRDLKTNRKVLIQTRSMTPKEYGRSLVRFGKGGMRFPATKIPTSGKRAGIPGAAAGLALGGAAVLSSRKRKAKKIARKAQKKARRKQRKK